MTNFFRVFKMGGINFWRNGWLSVAASTVMALTLFIISVFIILSFVLNIAVQAVNEEMDMSVYFKKEAKEVQILDLKYKLLSQEEVKDVKHITPEEALEIFKSHRTRKEDQRLIESISEGENPLPASLEIKVYDPNQLDKITEFLQTAEHKEIIDNTSYQNKEETIKKILGMTGYVKKIGIGLSIILVIISLVIIFNTIRITIFTRASEIEMMKLVGATDWYIRGPFVLEGVFYGVIATLASLLILYPILYLISPSVSRYFGASGGDMFKYFNEHFLTIIGLEILIGVFLGIISSIVAIQRYLKKI